MLEKAVLYTWAPSLSVYDYLFLLHSPHNGTVTMNWWWLKSALQGNSSLSFQRQFFPHVKYSKLYVYAYIWHSNEGDIPIFYLPLALLIKYKHRRIQVLLAMMTRVRFNSFQHNLLFLYVSIHSVPSAWTQARGVLPELGHIHVCKT